MFMLVVLVVHVRVIVSDRFVRVLVNMLLAQVQPDTDRHEETRGQQGKSDRFAQHHRERGTEEGRDREVGARSSGSGVTHADDE